MLTNSFLPRQITDKESFYLAALNVLVEANISKKRSASDMEESSPTEPTPLRKAQDILPPQDKRSKMTLEEAQKFWGTVPNKIADTELDLERQKRREAYNEKRKIFQQSQIDHAEQKRRHDRAQEQAKQPSAFSQPAPTMPTSMEIDKEVTDQRKILRAQRPLAAAKFRSDLVKTQAENNQQPSSQKQPPKYPDYIRYPRNIYGKDGNYGSTNDQLKSNPPRPRYQGNSLGRQLRAMTTLQKGRFESAKEFMDKLISATGHDMQFLSYLNGNADNSGLLFCFKCGWEGAMDCKDIHSPPVKLHITTDRKIYWSPRQGVNLTTTHGTNGCPLYTNLSQFKCKICELNNRIAFHPESDCKMTGIRGLYITEVGSGKMLDNVKKQFLKSHPTSYSSNSQPNPSANLTEATIPDNSPDSTPSETATEN